MWVRGMTLARTSGNRRLRASASWWPRPRARSTTFGAPRRTGVTRSPCSLAVRSCGHSPTGGRGRPPDARPLERERRVARGRRVARLEPPVPPARASGAPGFEERVRAGRVRLVLGLAGRRARVCMPGPGGAGSRARGANRRGSRRGGRAASGAGGVRGNGRRAVRVLHARVHRGGDRSPRTGTAAIRGGCARGAFGQPVPLYRLREDPRSRPGRLRSPASTRGRAVSERVGERTREGVGVSVSRIDGTPKAKGKFAYGSDLWADGMLWGHTLRSPHPSARIRSIDIAAAVASPGVHAVLLADDVPGSRFYGLEFTDQPVLAWEVVRYVGEPVALVAAEHPELARRAADAVL